jgi:hypothetical protein
MCLILRKNALVVVYRIDVWQLSEGKTVRLIETVPTNIVYIIHARK